MDLHQRFPHAWTVCIARDPGVAEESDGGDSLARLPLAASVSPRDLDVDRRCLRLPFQTRFKM